MRWQAKSVDGSGETATTIADGNLRGSDGKSWPLVDGLAIGRADSCDVQLADGSVSREHAQVRRGAAHWSVIDRGSRNGTSINGARVPMYVECPLRDGDRLGVGQVVLTVELSPSTDPDTTSGVYLGAVREAKEVLSPYQLQVVRCLAEPWSRGGEPATNAEIAAQLGTPLAVDAVKAALRRAYVKTGLADRPTHIKRRELCRIARDRAWL